MRNFPSSLVLFLVLVTVFVSNVAASLPSPTPDGWTRPSITVPLTTTPPTLDGYVTDAAWKNAFKISNFSRFTGSAPVVERTEAWITTDGKTLFVAFHCFDSAPELQRKSETQRGSQAVWGDDHVTVRIDSQHLHRGSSVFSVNPIGTQLESLEGGTAGNITWAGDWKASVKQTTDGWTAELAIPFSILRHAKGAKTIGLLLMRSMNRESNPVAWPEVPPEGQSMFSVAQFMPDVILPQAMPDVSPKTVILPFTIGTASSQGQKARFGLDIKQPINTTLTALVAVNPDFQTIEQQVASVNLSYNEQFVDDRRPFFAEGAQFLPDTELLYTRRLGQFDLGTKVVGRQGPTSIGFLSTTARSTPRERDAMAMSISQASGLFSGYGVSATTDNQYGVLSNRTARIFGNHGWVDHDRRNSIFAVRSQSWLNDEAKGEDSDIGFNSFATNGKARYSFLRSVMSQDFVSTLGLLKNPDRKNMNMSTSIRNQFDRGALLSYEVASGMDVADRISNGDFFYKIGYLSASGLLRNGLSASVDISKGDRKESDTARYSDHYLGTGVGWNQRSLFQGGGIKLGTGRQIGQAIKDFSISQGILVSKPFSIYGRYTQQIRTTGTVRQTIITGTFRLDTLRSLSIRLVSQNGTGNASNVGAQTGTNFYLAYSQRSRSGGADYFFVLGDPNAAATRQQVTLKVIQPL